MLSHVQRSLTKALSNLLFNEILLVLQQLVLLYEPLILHLLPPPLLTAVQWSIPLGSLQAYITHFL